MTKDYSTQVRVLRDVDLRVDHGDFIAITGPSGSGKSTLLNILGLLDRPTTGEVALDGADVGGLADRRRTDLRARSIGFMFQQAHLLAGRSAVDNVRLALAYSLRLTPAEERRRAAEALALVGLSNRETHDPDKLSGGEAQRVALARAIVKRPRLLLCDEPTGNLDGANTAHVMSILQSLLEEGAVQAILVVTHDPVVARHAARRVTLHDGTVTEA